MTMICPGWDSVKSSDADSQIIRWYHDRRPQHPPGGTPMSDLGDLEEIIIIPEPAPVKLPDRAPAPPVPVREPAPVPQRVPA